MFVSSFKIDDNLNSPLEGTRSVTIWPFHNGNHSLQMTQTKQHFRATLPFHGKSIRKNCIEVSSWLLVALLVIQAKRFFWQPQDHQKYQTCLAQTMKKRTQGSLLIYPTLSTNMGVSVLSYRLQIQIYLSWLSTTVSAFQAWESCGCKRDAAISHVT